MLVIARVQTASPEPYGKGNAVTWGRTGSGNVEGKGDVCSEDCIDVVAMMFRLGFGSAYSRRKVEGRGMAVQELCGVRTRRREGSGKKSRRIADEEMVDSALTRGALSRVADYCLMKRLYFCGMFLSNMGVVGGEEIACPPYYQETC